MFDIKQEFNLNMKEYPGLSLEESKMMFEASTSRINDTDFLNNFGNQLSQI